MLVKTNASKLWRFNYYKPFSQPKKRVLLGLGKFPEMTLAQARIKREEFLALLAQNVDPQTNRQQQEAEILAQRNNTLFRVALKWRAKKEAEVMPVTLFKNWARLEKHSFPRLGSLPITDISPTHLIEVVKHLDAQGKSDTLHRILRLANNILNFGVNTGVLPFNYCEKVSEAYHKKAKVNNPTIRPEALPKFLQAMAQSKADTITRYLIRWQLLTMVRPAEAVSAEWREIDWESRNWHIPAEKMKKTKKGANAHVVPLSTQAIALLSELRNISEGEQGYIFPHYSKPNTPMSSETANNAIKRMGYAGKLTAHGLRSIASTYLNEQLINYDVIEACLAHVIQDQTRKAYNRSDYLEQRKSVMQQWGDFVESCSRGI